MSFFFVLLVNFAYSFVLFSLCKVCCSYTFTTQCLSGVYRAVSPTHISLPLCLAPFCCLSSLLTQTSLWWRLGFHSVILCSWHLLCQSVVNLGPLALFPHVHSLCNPFDSVILTLNFLCSHLLYHLIISALLF